VALTGAAGLPDVGAEAAGVIAAVVADCGGGVPRSRVRKAITPSPATATAAATQIIRRMGDLDALLEWLR